MATRQRSHHQEMIRADTVMKVVRPILETVQMDVEVLKETAGVVLAFHRQSKAAPNPGVDAVGRDQVLAANELLLVVPIAMDDARGNAVGVLRQILERRVVIDAP